MFFYTRPSLPDPTALFKERLELARISTRQTRQYKPMGGLISASAIGTLATRLPGMLKDPSHIENPPEVSVSSR